MKANHNRDTMRNFHCFKETEIGLIPEGWKVESLPDVISHTVDNRGKSAPLSNAGIPLIATNCIKENGLYPVYEKIRFVSVETYKTWFRDHPQPDDIIIVNKGTPGLVCLVPNPVDFCIAQDMVAIRPNKSKIYGKFLFAYLRTPIFKYQVDSLNVGTTIPHLKKTWFSKLFIPIPTFSEQKFIGDTNYNLSKKIELNHQMNQTLEAIGQAIFRHWFVHFEFPDENGLPYKSSGGEMVDSELGEIPAGWDVSTLGNYIKLIKGCSYKSIDLNESKNALVTLKSIDRNGNFNKEGFKEYSGKFKDNQVLSDGDIVVAQTDLTQKAEVLGKPVIVRSFPNYEKLIASLDLGIVRPKGDYLNKEFIYHALKTKTFHTHAIGYANGTTVLHLNKDAVTKYELPIPHKSILNQFKKLIGPINDQTNNNNLESGNLSQIRDSLLPKLMSGKVRVPMEASAK